MATKQEGGSEVLPLQKKGGVENVLDMLKGGHNKFEVVLMWEFDVLAIVMGGAQSFHFLKGGVQNILPCLEEGTQKKSDPRFSHYVAPRPRN